jgi:hypothetical protein
VSYYKVLTAVCSPNAYFYHPETKPGRKCALQGIEYFRQPAIKRLVNKKNYSIKKILALLFVCTLAISSYAQDVIRESIETGSQVPALPGSLEDVVSGKTIDIKDLIQNNGLLVIFSCNTCPYVLGSMPRMEEMLAYARKNNIGVAVLNSNEAQRADADAPEAMKKLAAAHHYPNYFIDKDSKVADIFGASRTPEVFLFTKAGKLVYKGAMDDNVPDPQNAHKIFLRNAIDNMIAGKAIEPDATKSIGCSIKRMK